MPKILMSLIGQQEPTKKVNQEVSQKGPKQNNCEVEQTTPQKLTGKQNDRIQGKLHGAKHMGVIN